VGDRGKTKENVAGKPLKNLNGHFKSDDPTFGAVAKHIQKKIANIHLWGFPKMWVP
jgi:hypothetical protein